MKAAVCSECGSADCLRVDMPVCRHTRRFRKAEFRGDNLVQRIDRMVHRPQVAKAAIEGRRAQKESING